MQLNRQTDYAFRTLIYLAAQPADTRVQVRQVNDVFKISANHLSKVVNKLANLGYIESYRGRGGGIHLAQAPKDINVGEVVRAMEPTLNPIDCEGLECALLPSCRLKSVLSDASDAFVAVLDSYTLADLVEGELKVLRGLS